NELPDLSGKVVVVTGGNSGVGFATILHLARHGAKVYMAARNEQRATAAIERLRAAGLGPGNGEVIWLPLDYSDPRLAKAAAEELMEKEDRLDLFLSDMGIFRHTRCCDGQSLLPLMKKTASEPNSDVRIVEVSSAGHAIVPSNVCFKTRDDLNRDCKDTFFDKSNRYNLTKFMGMLHVKELQRRLDAEGVPIIVMGVHPGIAYAHSAGPVLSPVYTFIANMFFTPPEKGAYSTTFAAAAPAVRTDPETYRGAYIVPPGKVAPAGKQVQNAELAKELWETTE
ncbi:predicted protein, partial [Postia placenta Mad-698-R]